MIAERKPDNRAVVNRTIRDRASLTQTWEPPRKRRTMAFRGPLILRGAQELHFRSPEALVVLVASFCVSMFCFYVAAYARVTSDGIKAVDLEHRAIAAEQETERLHAHLSLVIGPANVARRAKEMKMILGANAAKISNVPFNPIPNTLPPTGLGYPATTVLRPEREAVP